MCAYVSDAAEMRHRAAAGTVRDPDRSVNEPCAAGPGLVSGRVGVAGRIEGAHVSVF
jgi:hypothetical protein